MFGSGIRLETASFDMSAPSNTALNLAVRPVTALCILRQMEKIRDLMSEPSFKEHREGEFPYKTFEAYKLTHERTYS